MSATFEVGDYVTCVSRSRNGVGEGIIFKIAKTKGEGTFKQFQIVPVWTVTGASVIRPKWARDWELKKFGLPEFAQRIQELTALAELYLKEKSGATGVEES